WLPSTAISTTWRRPALGFAMAIIVVGAVMMWSAPPLSAKNVLAQAEARELFAVRRVDVVVSTKVRIERVNHRTGRVDSLGTLETARDSSGPAIRAVRRSAAGEWQQEVFASEDALAGRGWFRSDLGPLFGRYAESHHWVPEASIAGY